MRKVIIGSMLGGGIGALLGGILALILFGVETSKEAPIGYRVFSEVIGSAAGSIVGAIAAATNVIVASLGRENLVPPDEKQT